MCLELPGGVVGREGFGALPPAFFKGRAGGQALKTITVEGAGPGEGVLLGIAREGSVKAGQLGASPRYRFVRRRHARCLPTLG